MKTCCDQGRYFAQFIEVPGDAGPLKFCPWCGAERNGPPTPDMPAPTSEDPDGAAIRRLENIANGEDPRWDPIYKAAATLVWLATNGGGRGQIEQSIGRLSDRFHERLSGRVKP